MSGWGQLIIPKRIPTFACGHPRVPQNTRYYVGQNRTLSGIHYYHGERCLTCHREDNRTWWTRRSRK